MKKISIFTAFLMLFVCLTVFVGCADGQKALFGAGENPLNADVASGARASLRGDLNGDGSVNVLDISVVVKIASGQSIEQEPEVYPEEDTEEIAGKTYTVVFRYVDENGMPLCDYYSGFSLEKQKGIVFGESVSCAKTNNLDSFSNYVIVGWNTSLAKAKAGIVDPYCTENVKGDRTLYSVVREKRSCVVTLLDEEGELFNVVSVTEGNSLFYVPRPSVDNKSFYAWENVDPDSPSTENCVLEDSTFRAVMYDANATYQVLFKCVDSQGNAMASIYGLTEYLHTGIAFGGRVQHRFVNDIQTFDDYVIIGWNSDIEKAKAGIIDPECTENIRSDRTLYSVVREKDCFEVALLDASGNVLQTLSIKEGNALPSDIAKPVQVGKAFSHWGIVGDDSISTPDCIRDNCSFMAVMRGLDGTIGKVAAGSIVVDGKRDYAYSVSGAMLPVNQKRQSDGAKTVAQGGSRAPAVSRTDAYVVWDGDYIYLLIEVYDKTLVGRAESYVKGGIDAWLNDTIELWYTFEKGEILRNNTRIGIDAMGVATYALGRSRGIGGGRSTHYTEIEYATRDSLHDAGSDLSSPSSLGITSPSYIIELKIPAKTEGKADVEKYPNLSGAELETFLATGLIPGRDPQSNDPNDYAFTDGEKLVAGDVVYLNLTVHDLMLTQAQLDGRTGELLDSPSEERLIADLGYDYQKVITGLYALDDVTGRLTGSAYSCYAKFSAAGATQMNVQYYLTLCLGDTAKGENTVWSLGVDENNNTVFYDKDGNVYTH